MTTNIATKNGVSNSQDGGEAILEAFRNLQIEYIISSPGSEWPPVWEALARQKLSRRAGPKYLDCGHETLAVAIAAGYARFTGQMSAVLLHAGSGILQGSMAIQGARASEIPMIIMSGESLSYGEVPGFDPGNQWYRNLGVVGGPQRLAEPLVKWANQAPSSETLYQIVIRAGEMSQRKPQGPVYLNVPCETMLQNWTPPKRFRQAPAAPKLQSLPIDIERVAKEIEAAEYPIIITENLGKDAHAFDALVKFVDLMAIPVFEGRAAAYANFPKSHPLYLGTDVATHLHRADLILLVDSRVPWYPARDTPEKAKIVAISDNPLKDYMVYQNLEADYYLEGDVFHTITSLTSTLAKNGQTRDQRDKRRMNWSAEHKTRVETNHATQTLAERDSTISAAQLCKALNDTLPSETIYVDETIVHSPIIREFLDWEQPRSFFRTPSGLGQGLGIALGVKLGAEKQPVVLLIGDGTFLYNPVLSGLTFSKDQKRPILIIVLNNNKYEIMRRIHLSWYPDGVSATEKDHYGVHINNPDYSELALWTGGTGQRVDHPSQLRSAIKAAYNTVQAGRTAILNVMLNE